MGSWHPECPDRLDAISDQLLASGLAPYLHENSHPEPVTREALKAVNDLLIHRGPVAEGFYTAGGVGLAMRRLSIIDLSTGNLTGQIRTSPQPSK